VQAIADQSRSGGRVKFYAGGRSGNQYCATGGAILIDFGTQDWYTRRPLACKKCLILLGFCERRGNPSLSATICFVGDALKRRILASRCGLTLVSSIFDRTTSPFTPCGISCSITTIAGSAVTNRASGVSSRILELCGFRFSIQSLTHSNDTELEFQSGHAYPAAK
jgi:hypothetical protein